MKTNYYECGYCVTNIEYNDGENPNGICGYDWDDVLAKYSVPDPYSDPLFNTILEIKKTNTFGGQAAICYYCKKDIFENNEFKYICINCVLESCLYGKCLKCRKITCVYCEAGINRNRTECYECEEEDKDKELINSLLSQLSLNIDEQNKRILPPDKYNPYMVILHKFSER